MQRYRLTVPAGVGPGQSFLVSVNGQKMRVTCPAGVYTGMQLEIQAPAGPPAGHGGHGGHHGPGKHHGGPPPPQPPPPPPPPAMQAAPAPAAAQALGQQCQASRDAEARLRQGHPPDAMLIFSAMDRDGSNSVTADELQFGLSQGKMDFSLKTCRLLINLYDTSRDGSVDRSEFQGLWGYLQQWRECFEAHDKDKSGLIGHGELKAAIEQVGYKFSDKFFKRLFDIYGTEKAGGLGFDMFVALFCELHKLTEAFKTKDTNYSGNATFQYEEFLDAAYSIHT